jgi:hypothetical protein
MSGPGTNWTNRADLVMSVPRGNSEVAFRAVRRNWRIAVLMGGAESDPGPAGPRRGIRQGPRELGRTCGPS